ncbi:ABC transporter substrate-binding protein [Saccharopolyspora sp. HNM0983]|uniref:ABC transporter substrate-binding protein n=1 Tax=Saccharopolyspora montiporae TaxID=2781240 RepID=A0A929FWG2_9PSEU|nr:ABC transporter substrate-binding protein [Saccharopolyspora sp. HNM0983]MBE9373506.1 ABC transporter substrate-binding protein [Saccharopolyspora sp. HNM0983]
MRRGLVVLVVIAFGGLLTAGAPPPGAEPERGGTGGGATLRVGLQQQIDSLNPFLGYSLAATDLFRLIYPTLTTYSAQDFAPEPELAESWEVSADRLTWTFRIRDGVRWSDGAPVTAGDAAYTFNRMMRDPAAATANGNVVENFEAVRAADDRTLVVRTARPQATMLAIDAPIVPEHVWSRIGDIASFDNEDMPIVGSGPFELVDHRAEQNVTLRADPDFWRGPPQVDRVQFVQFKNSDAAVQALRKAEVDVVQKLTPAQFDALAEEPDVQQVRGQGRRFYELILNPGAAGSDGEPIGTGHPALRDVRVRQALDRAIDRRVLVDRVLRGYGEQGAGYLPPIFGTYHWRPEQPRTFDPAAAARELDAAGYRRGPDGVRRTPQGRPLDFDFVLHGSEPADAQVGEFVQRWFADLGIRVTLEPVSDNQVNDRTSTGDFDMVISGWSANPDPDYVLRLQTCAARPGGAGAGSSDTFLCDERYDELYDRQLGEFDPARRAELVERAQRRFHEQAAGLILYYQDSLEAYRSDRFAGFTRQPAQDGVIVAQQGYWGYYGADPTEQAERGTPGQGAAVLWVIGGAAVLVGTVGTVRAARRRATADQRE